MEHGWGQIPNRENYIVCSPSALMALRKDPEIYKMRYIDKVDDTTEAMAFGTLVHKRVLEPELFANEYAILPEKNAANDYDSERLKAMCKEFGEKVTGTKRELAERIRNHLPDFVIWEELLDEVTAKGLKSLPISTFKKLNQIYEKIMAHEKVGEWIRVADKEKKGYWTHPSGVVMSFVADAFFMFKGVGICIDLKITTHFEPNRFMRNLYESGYHMQAAAYCQAISDIEGQSFDNFLFVTIEPAAPHRVRFLQLDSAAIEAGKVELNKYIHEFKQRSEQNDWSPRSIDTQIQQVSLASWDWEKIQEVE
jgi:exodeoxyribonuclease VIII